jgi:hypothetical protein
MMSLIPVRFHALRCLVAIATMTSTSAADVEIYYDKADWEAAVGAYTTIDFTGFPEGTLITDQYADLGVLFTDGNDFIDLNDTAFPNDGAGLLGNMFDDIELAFDQPTSWLGLEFPGGLWLRLYRDGELMYTSPVFDGAYFTGLVSSEPFDAVDIIDVSGESVAIDDLHFGPPIPAQGALALLAVAGLTRRTRGRSVGR